MTYPGGSFVWCPQGHNRTFSLDVQCAPVPAQSAAALASVFESNACDYRMPVKSIAGCPTTCITGAASICSDEGVCGYDTDANVSHCFCNVGFSGATCASNSTRAQLESLPSSVLPLPPGSACAAIDFGNSSFDLTPFQAQE